MTNSSPASQRAPRILICLACLGLSSAPVARAHDLQGHRGPTYEITAPIEPSGERPVLILSVLDDETSQPTAARFSLTVDGQAYDPESLGRGGLRFVSVHEGKKQRFVACYARGDGPVEIPLPADSQTGTLTIAKGFEHLCEEVPFRVAGKQTRVAVRMKRWSELKRRGWLPAEEHLHYDRLDPAHDKDWLTIMAADDLTHAHFLVLKGGNLPGVWARQYAYGPQGEAFDGERLIRPGEEYRDSLQGHINLLGVEQVIQPISTGGMGQPRVDDHYPAFHDVLCRARELGGIGGPAHGTALGRSPTGVADAVLGAVDFFEIANTHLYELDVWYQLLNCGYLLAPAAGTDLPNFPFRDPWQPLLGETRMYVRLDGARDFASWKEAVRQGKVFITSGPLITLSAGGVGPGGTVRLPAGGGEVLIEAELASHRELQSFQLISNGEVAPATGQQRTDGRVHRWSIRQRLRLVDSGWLAARGQGAAKKALAAGAGIEQNAVAHTGVVRVLVGDRPIQSAPGAEILIGRLQQQQDFYRSHGKYAKTEDRDRALEIFSNACAELKRQLHDWEE